MQATRCCAASLAAWLVVAGAQAGNFSAIPVRITLVGAAPTSLLLENQGEEAVLVQSEVLAWSQRDGKDELVASRDLLISPPIFKLAAGGKHILAPRLAHRHRHTRVEEDAFKAGYLGFARRFKGNGTGGIEGDEIHLPIAAP